MKTTKKQLEKALNDACQLLSSTFVDCSNCPTGIKTYCESCKDNFKSHFIAKAKED